jgi:hypothetical protein
MFNGTMKESRRKATALQGWGQKGEGADCFQRAALGAAPLVAFSIHLEPILRFALKQHTKKGLQTPPSSAKPILTIILLRDFSFKSTQSKPEF